MYTEWMQNGGLFSLPKLVHVTCMKESLTTVHYSIVHHDTVVGADQVSSNILVQNHVHWNNLVAYQGHTLQISVVEMFGAISIQGMVIRKGQPPNEGH